MRREERKTKKKNRKESCIIQDHQSEVLWEMSDYNCNKWPIVSCPFVRGRAVEIFFLNN